MAISRLVWKPDFHTNLGYARFICDSEDDISNLPTTSAKGYGLEGDYQEVSPGSVAQIVNLRKVYELNNEDEWRMQVYYGETSGGEGLDIADDGFGNVSII